MTGQTVELERPERVVEHSPGLTRSLDYRKEGLAVNATRICSVEACTGRVHAKGMCDLHYRRTRYSNPRKPAHERFWLAVKKTEGCWRWGMALDRYGYGAFTVNDHSVKAHRYAYELLVGPIPRGLTIDHLCNNPACVNPAHMEPVTISENLRRRHARARLAKEPKTETKENEL